MSEKLVLIDGNSIINRAFFGVPDLTSADGLHTNAIYGFLNILFSILSEENADYLCVAFDVHAPTFRHKMYDAYKGTRKGMPDELREQVPVLKDLLKAMNVRTIEIAGYEADDILGTLARRGEKEGFEVSLVSGDRDLLQIATDKILIRIPKTKGGKTTIENYHTEDVINAYGLKPLQIIELKALMGDSSDNIPGVPKVGEKTATELLKLYGNIETLKEHIPDVTKKSIRESLEQHFDMAELSKTLATIDTNAPVECDFEELRFTNPYTDEAYRIVKRLGFKNMLSRFEGALKNENTDISGSFIIEDDFARVSGILDSISEHEQVGFYFSGEYKGDSPDRERELFGLSLCFDKEKTYFIPVGGLISAEYLSDTFVQRVFENKKIKLSTFDFKLQLKFAKGMADHDFAQNHVFDILLAAYINNPLKNDYLLEDIANEYLGLIIKSKSEYFGKKSLKDSFNESMNDFAEYSSYFAYVAFLAMDSLKNRLIENGEEKLFSQIEMPLTVSLNNMENEGILVKREIFDDLSDNLSGEISTLETLIYEGAGERFNINSPSQLGNILFEKMQIPGGKKTKTGYSTAADVLEKLSADYPFVSDVLKYRALTKLKSTYAEGLKTCIAKDNRIHSTFNQTITATGRISSTEPNLQNIPVRLEQGRLIRKAFVPREGCVFVDADYSQIELRIMAHLSNDERLIEAFNKGDDIHAITASEVFNTPLDEVTPAQRRNAKAVNFGIIYGISSFGLGQDLNISRKEAKEYIEHYFETFPKVKQFLDEQVETAKSNGYVQTLFGRRRPLPEISSSNFMQRSFGERVAMNAPIQGTAADIMKMAMINVDKRLLAESLKSRVILQVHDELMIEAYTEELAKVRNVLAEEMMNAAKLSVKLLVETATGNDWYEAK